MRWSSKLTSASSSRTGQAGLRAGPCRRWPDDRQIQLVCRPWLRKGTSWATNWPVSWAEGRRSWSSSTLLYFPLVSFVKMAAARLPRSGEKRVCREELGHNRTSVAGRWRRTPYWGSVLLLHCAAAGQSADPPDPQGLVRPWVVWMRARRAESRSTGVAWRRRSSSRLSWGTLYRAPPAGAAPRPAGSASADCIVLGAGPCSSSPHRTKASSMAGRASARSRTMGPEARTWNKDLVSGWPWRWPPRPH